MPLTRGHVLVTSRDHHERLSGLGVKDGEEVCLSFSYSVLLDSKFCIFWGRRERYGV